MNIYFKAFTFDSHLSVAVHIFPPAFTQQSRNRTHVYFNFDRNTKLIGSFLTGPRLFFADPFCGALILTELLLSHNHSVRVKERVSVAHHIRQSLLGALSGRSSILSRSLGSSLLLH